MSWEKSRMSWEAESGREVKDELGTQIKEVKNDLKVLDHRQTDLEHHGYIFC